MSRSGVGRLFGWVVLAGLLVSPPAVADGDTADETLIRHGIALRKEQRDEEALAEFHRAFAIRPTARARAQIALAEQALGQWVPAEEDLVAAIAAADDPWITRNRETLDVALETVRAHVGTIEVTTNVRDSELLVNGSAVGRAQHTTIRVATGSVLIEARAPGYTSARRLVDVTPRAWIRETITLVSLQGPALIVPSDARGASASIAAPPRRPPDRPQRAGFPASLGLDRPRERDGFPGRRHRRQRAPRTACRHVQRRRPVPPRPARSQVRR